jgi:hypothetical protein
MKDYQIELLENRVKIISDLVELAEICVRLKKFESAQKHLDEVLNYLTA